MISIEADDLPDAVYVEGSLEGGGSRSIVFIEDDVDADVLTPESDRDLRRGIEPRMRERRLAVKRAQGRKRLKWLVAACDARDPGGRRPGHVRIVAVRDPAPIEVTITGNVYTDPERLQAVVDDLVGTPVLIADTAARPSASSRRSRGSTTPRSRPTSRTGVTIEIRERQAVATYQGPDGQFRVLDREGRVLDVLEQLPVRVRPHHRSRSGRSRALPNSLPQGYKACSRAGQEPDGHRSRTGRAASRSPPNGSRLRDVARRRIEVRFGEARDLFAKLVRLETVLTQNPERAPGPIDVSTSQATLRPS